jgi:cell division septal protein FtsQ
MMRTMAPDRPSATQRETMQQDDLERRKRVRRSTLVVTAVVLFFYLGFIAMMMYRALHRH